MKISKIHIFFQPTFCTKKPCFKALIHAPIGLSAGDAQKFFSLNKSLAVAFWPTSALECSQLPKDPGFSGNFRNVSNFEELYLRAQ